MYFNIPCQLASNQSKGANFQKFGKFLKFHSELSCFFFFFFFFYQKIMLSGNFIMNDIPTRQTVIAKLGIFHSKLGYFISVCQVQEQLPFNQFTHSRKFQSTIINVATYIYCVIKLFQSIIQLASQYKASLLNIFHYHYIQDAFFSVSCYDCNDIGITFLFKLFVIHTCIQNT